MLHPVPRLVAAQFFTLVVGLFGPLGSSAHADRRAERPASVRAHLEPEQRVATLTWTLRRTAWLDAPTAAAEALCLQDARRKPLESGLARLKVMPAPDRITVDVRGPVASSAAWWTEARPAAWLRALSTCAAAPAIDPASPWTPRRLLEALVAPAAGATRGFTRAAAVVEYSGPEPPTPLARLAEDLLPLASAPPAQPRVTQEAPAVQVGVSPTAEAWVLLALRVPASAAETLAVRMAARAQTETVQWGDDTYVLVGVRAHPAEVDTTWDALWAELRTGQAHVADGASALVLAPPAPSKAVGSAETGAGWALWAESLRDRAARSLPRSAEVVERRPGEFVTRGGRTLVYAATPDPTFAVRWRWRLRSPMPADLRACLRPPVTEIASVEVATVVHDDLVDVTVMGPADRLSPTLAWLKSRAANLTASSCFGQSIVSGQAALEAWVSEAPAVTFVTGKVSFDHALEAAALWPAKRPSPVGRIDSPPESPARRGGSALTFVVHDRSPRTLAAVELALTAIAGDEAVWSQRPSCAPEALCFEVAGLESPDALALERVRARLRVLAAEPLPPTPFDALRARRKADVDLAWSEPIDRLDWLAAQAARPHCSVARDAPDRWLDALDRATSADVQASARALALTP
jgi:hypothetical protein